MTIHDCPLVIPLGGMIDTISARQRPVLYTLLEPVGSAFDVYNFFSRSKSRSRQLYSLIAVPVILFDGCAHEIVSMLLEQGKSPPRSRCRMAGNLSSALELSPSGDIILLNRHERWTFALQL